MRLSTTAPHDDDAAIAVIHAALDGGVRLLDTAAAYGVDEADCGHNERLIARALAAWTGDRDAVVIATKTGMSRPKGAWLPDGRAKAIATSCEASLKNLGRDRIDLLQIHAPDHRTPWSTSVRALAKLVKDGLARAVGLCNVTVDQIEAARAEIAIASVQIELSPFEDDALLGGVVDHCARAGIRVLAHRPLGGIKRVARLARLAVFAEVAVRHDVTPADIALAWLRHLHPAIVPLPGPTTIANAERCAAIDAIRLSAEDKSTLDDAVPATWFVRTPPDARRVHTRGDIVVMMGIPAAGKSTHARALVDDGHARLSRDIEGGTLAALEPKLAALLAAGHDRIVLDNTYPRRAERARVIACAARHGVAVRCLWIDTSLERARIHAVTRILTAHGRLLEPDELITEAKRDAIAIPPRAQHDYERVLEPPSDDEGFVRIERTTPPEPAPSTATPKLWIVDVDRVCVDPIGPSWQAMLDAIDPTALLAGWAWRPQWSNPARARDEQTAEAARLTARFGRTVQLWCCTHPAGAPVCWCRPPMPGLVLAAAHAAGVALAQTVMVVADRNGERFAAHSGVRSVDRLAPSA